jgi:hypothetical protein
MGFLSDAKDNMDRLHRSRALQLSDMFEPTEVPVDTGSARVESYPNRAKPVGDQDFGGFIVVTNERMIYRDYRSTIFVKWIDILSLEKVSMRQAMTTGFKLRLKSGEVYEFSGNTPFIRKLLKQFSRGSLPF